MLEWFRVGIVVSWTSFQCQYVSSEDFAAANLQGLPVGVLGYRSVLVDGRKRMPKP